jgi:hypothetical protein
VDEAPGVKPEIWEAIEGIRGPMLWNQYTRARVMA